MLKPGLSEGDPIRGRSTGRHLDDVLVIREIRECNPKLGKVRKFHSDDRMIFTGRPNEINFQDPRIALIVLKPISNTILAVAPPAKCAAGHLLPSNFA